MHSADLVPNEAAGLKVAPARIGSIELLLRPAIAGRLNKIQVYATCF